MVVVSQVLACDATLGYEDLFNIRVQRFNGTKIRNLRHLAEMVYADKDAKYMRFDLDYDVSCAAALLRVLVLVVARRSTFCLLSWRGGGGDGGGATLWQGDSGSAPWFGDAHPWQ